MAEHMCVIGGCVGGGGGGWCEIQISGYHLLQDISLFLHCSSEQFHLFFVLRKYITIVLYIK